jgi:hypothetical protein
MYGWGPKPAEDYSEAYHLAEALTVAASAVSSRSSPQNSSLLALAIDEPGDAAGSTPELLRRLVAAAGVGELSGFLAWLR